MFVQCVVLVRDDPWSSTITIPSRVLIAFTTGLPEASLISNVVLVIESPSKGNSIDTTAW